MPVKSQNVTIPLLAGRDAESHKFVLQQPLLLECQNAVFNERGAIAKRTGSTDVAMDAADGDTLVPLGVSKFKNTPLLFTSPSDSKPSSVAAYTNSEWQVAESADRTTRQTYVPCSVRTKEVRHNKESQVEADRAKHAGTGLTMYCWRNLDSSFVEWAVKSGDTYLQTAGSTRYANGQHPVVRVVGDYFHFYYYDTSANNLELEVVDTADPYTAPTSYTLVSGSAVQYYDVTVSGGFAYVASGTNPGSQYEVRKLNPDGTTSATASPLRTTSQHIAIAVHPTAARLVVARIDVGAIHLDYLTTALADTVDLSNDITTGTNWGYEIPLENLTVAIANDDLTYTFWDVERVDINILANAVGGVGGDLFYPAVRMVSHRYLFAPLFDDEDVAYHSILASRATLNTENSEDRILLALGYHGILWWYDTPIGLGTTFDDDSAQKQIVVIDALNAETGSRSRGADTWSAYLKQALVARFLPGEALVNPYSNAVVAPNFPDYFFDTRGFLPQLDNPSTDVYAMAVSTRRELLNLRERARGSEWGVTDVTLTLNDTAAMRGEEAGSATYFPSGYLAQYDGSLITEAGFFTYPENVYGLPIENGNGTGFLQDTDVISWRFYWEWRNSAGELELSTFAGSVEHTLARGFANTSVTFHVPTLQYTAKDNVRLAVFRTADGGSTYYRCSSPDPADSSYVLNDPGQPWVEWVDDTYSDDELVTNELDVGFNSGALDNVAANSPQVMATNQERLFYVDPSRSDRVHFSLLRDAGETLQFNEALQLAIPSFGGEITALSAGESVLWIFKERATYISSGDGPNNLGQGPAYGRPTIVAAGVGCEDPVSVVHLPIGVMFKSEKGFYLADRGYNISYVGAGVKDYDSETVTAAVAVPDEHRVIFYTASRALVFNYRFRQWSVWTTPADSAVLVGDSAYWLSGSSLRKGDSTVYQDAAKYTFSVTTNWIGGPAQLGKLLFRWWSILAEYRDNHVLEVDVSYDRREAEVDNHLIDYTGETGSPTPPTVGDRLGPRRRFSRDKVSAVKFKISDASWRTDGGEFPVINQPEDSFILNGITLAIAPLGGLNTDGNAATDWVDQA